MMNFIRQFCHNYFSVKKYLFTTFCKKQRQSIGKIKKLELHINMKIIRKSWKWLIISITKQTY